MLISLSTSICQLQRSGSDPNLIAGLSWQAGASTTLSVAGGKARATAQSAVVNPRIIKGPFQITNGVVYRVTGTMYNGTQSGFVVARVSSLPDVSSADVFGWDSTVSFAINTTFVAPYTGPAYFGFVVVVDGVAQYAEIDDAFLVKVEP